MPSLVLRPGMFVRLKQQPIDLPDFVLEHCSGRDCWVRQQTWGPQVHLRVKTVQIEIREDPGLALHKCRGAGRSATLTERN